MDVIRDAMDERDADPALNGETERTKRLLAEFEDWWADFGDDDEQSVDGYLSALEDAIGLDDNEWTWLHDAIWNASGV